MSSQSHFFRSLLFLFLCAGLIAALLGRGMATGSAPVLDQGLATVPGEATAKVAVGRATPSPSVPPPTPTVTPVPTPTPIPAPAKVRAVDPPWIGAVAAIVVDEQSGAVLYAKNEHLERAPASITKIITAIVALENGRPDDVVEVTYDASELIDSTLMGLYPYDDLTLRDLLYGLMLPSGNDAALAIANHIAGSKRRFAEMMNKRMADLGLVDSNFVNPHGLDARGHYTSAYDMAMVSRYGMRNETFRELSVARSYNVTLVRQGERLRYPIYNLNRLLTVYKGGDGIKVGYTEDAGHTIVGSATRDGHRVIVAVLGSNNLWVDTPPLLDYAFNNYSWPESSLVAAPSAVPGAGR